MCSPAPPPLRSNRPLLHTPPSSASPRGSCDATRLLLELNIASPGLGVPLDILLSALRDSMKQLSSEQTLLWNDWLLCMELVRNREI